jgi:hypothetical protein
MDETKIEDVDRSKWTHPRITTRQVKANDQQPQASEPVKLIGRPEDGPRCACGRVLYPYEHDKCLHCARLNIIAAREGQDFVKRLTSPRRSHRKQASAYQTAAGATD